MCEVLVLVGYTGPAPAVNEKPKLQWKGERLEPDMIWDQGVGWGDRMRWITPLAPPAGLCDPE